MAGVFENVISLTNTFTGVSFACTCSEIAAPYQFRTALLKSNGAAGAIDAHAGARDPIDARTVTLKIVHVYNQFLPPARQTPGVTETYTSVWAAFDAVCGSGYAVTLTRRDANGNLWYNTARVKSVDKKQALTDLGSVEIPVTFEFPTPYWYAQYKAGVARYDTGLFYDAIGLYYDADPDKFALSTTGTATSHVVSNTGIGGGTIPDYGAGFYIAGPVTGPVNITNYSVLALNGTPVYLQYNANVAAGEVVIIDGVNLECTSTVIGPSAYANLYVPYANGQDTWFQIAPGTNTIGVNTGAASGSGAYVTVNYAPYQQ